MARKRNHPLVPLVCWLGISLVMCVLALAIVLARQATPPDPEPDWNGVFTQGMVQGNALCGER